MAKTNYTLLIICEGENTEPQFFRSIRDRIMEGIYEVEDMKITVRPEPKLVDEAQGERQNELKPVRKPRSLLPAKKPLENENKVPLPLKWVLEGQQELQDGTFNEVWVVFDHDNHPARKEAFEQAKQEINGVWVQTAFSSIAFEYYLLLHFERIYRKFQTSECREGKKVIYCSSGKHANDCYGARCIGGYARSLGYWDDSKGDVSIFPLIENRLKTGYWNASWLRRESDRLAAGDEYYDRNPFVTTDRIIKRLTGSKGHHFLVLEIGEELVLGDKLLILLLPDRLLRVYNIHKIAIVIPSESISRWSAADVVIERHGERRVIDPGEHVELSYAPPGDGEPSRYSFEYDNWHVLLNE